MQTQKRRKCATRSMWTGLGGCLLSLLVLPVAAPASGHAQTLARAYGCATTCFVRAFIQGFAHITSDTTDKNDKGRLVSSSREQENEAWTLASTSAFPLTSQSGVPYFEAARLTGAVTSYTDEGENTYPGCSTQKITNALVGVMPLTGFVNAVPRPDHAPPDVRSYIGRAEPIGVPAPHVHHHDTGYTCGGRTAASQEDKDISGGPSTDYAEGTVSFPQRFSLNPQHEHTIHLGFHSPIHMVMHKPGGPGLLTTDIKRMGDVYILVDLVLCPDQGLRHNCHLKGRRDLPKKTT